MNIEEARKVLWLHNYPRPLGELFDEGYLNQSRLEWAAKKAHNPKLRDAAKVLLKILPNTTQEQKPMAELPSAKPKDKAFSISMSLEKARVVPWPLHPFKGQPMGALLDSKQLSLKDLGYAVENAWEEKVRQAAIALLLVRLEQVVKEPTPSAGFVHVVSGGRSYSEQKQLALTLIQGLLIGIVLAVAVVWTVVSIINAATPHPNPNSKPLSYFLSSPGGIISLVFALGFFIFLGLLFNYLFNLITKK